MRLTVVALDQHYTKRYTLGRNNSHFNMKDSQATDTDQFNPAGVNPGMEYNITFAALPGSQSGHQHNNHNGWLLYSTSTQQVSRRRRKYNSGLCRIPLPAAAAPYLQGIKQPLQPEKLGDYQYSPPVYAMPHKSVDIYTFGYSEFMSADMDWMRCAKRWRESQTWLMQVSR